MRCVVLALCAVALAGGCARRAERTPQPQAVRAESRDVDRALRDLRDNGVVDSYRIEDERLEVTVDPDAWKRLGTERQDAFKASLWSAWAASYRRIQGPGDGQIFLVVRDTQGTELGSYFRR